jgi:hypothetical protein
MHVCYRAQQDQVGKDLNTVYALYGSLGFMIIGGGLLTILYKWTILFIWIW